MIQFYMDEQVAIAIAKGLKRRGIDVLTSQEAEMLGTSDKDQLEFAKSCQRVLFTQDVDFLKLHASGTKHTGIVYSRQGTNIGDIIRNLQLIHEILDVTDMKDHVEFI